MPRAQLSKEGQILKFFADSPLSVVQPIYNLVSDTVRERRVAVREAEEKKAAASRKAAVTLGRKRAEAERKAAPKDIPVPGPAKAKPAKAKKRSHHKAKKVSRPRPPVETELLAESDGLDNAFDQL